MPATQKASKGTSTQNTAADTWTDDEVAAMQEHAKELKTARSRAGKADKQNGEQDVLAKIAEMPVADRAIAERIHAIVKENAPGLTPRTYYGMPAYARDGKVICFFQPASKFKARYSTLGFNDDANLDEGSMWPTSWALTELTRADEARIVELVKRSVS
jgi:uncharacterized protein YdhG (YjbR/CyaY superfamily)